MNPPRPNTFHYGFWMPEQVLSVVILPPTKFLMNSSCCGIVSLGSRGIMWDTSNSFSIDLDSMYLLRNTGIILPSDPPKFNRAVSFGCRTHKTSQI
jgi:hypothetical protein